MCNWHLRREGERERNREKAEEKLEEFQAKNFTKSNERP